MRILEVFLKVLIIFITKLRLLMVRLLDVNHVPDSMNEERFICSVGDLLWAKIGNHPFWPCMVSYDPMNGFYYKTKKVKNGEIRIYHVQYFGKIVQRGWTTNASIFRFEGEQEFHNKKAVLISNGVSASIKKKLNIKYSVPPAVEKLWHVAVQEAEVAFQLDSSIRFQKFVFKYELNLQKTPAANRTSSKRSRKHKKETNKSSKKMREALDVIQDLCVICEKGGVDLLCTGHCFHNYHKACLGMINAPKDFICLECERGHFICFPCKVAGTSARQCDKCNYYYHDFCLEKYACANSRQNICSVHVCLTCYNKNPNSISSKGPFVQCFRCPTLFHANEKCMPVGCVKLTPHLILCPEHFLGKDKVSHQPSLNVTYCIECNNGGNLICCETCPYAYHAQCIKTEVPAGDFFCDSCSKRQYLYVGMIVWAKAGLYRWWPAQILHPDDLPTNIKNMDKYEGEFPIQYFGTDEYSWTHRGRVHPYLAHHVDFIHPGLNHCNKLNSQYKISLEEAAEAFLESEKGALQSKPDAYKHIRVNRAIPPAQINAKSVLQCTCKASDPNPCSSDSMCLNRSMLMECHPNVCVAGECCENQKFQKRQYPQLKVIRTESCGWGLISRQFIPKGSFIIEYVGEVITHQEYHKRTLQMREENITNYYFLYLDNERMIDAGPKGNHARFINHSCSPNCEMQKWSVSGDVRVGIFALADIQDGVELTFDYKSDSFPFEQACKCGAPKCRKLIGRAAEKQNGKKLKVLKN